MLQARGRVKPSVGSSAVDTNGVAWELAEVRRG